MNYKGLRDEMQIKVQGKVDVFYFMAAISNPSVCQDILGANNMERRIKCTQVIR
jgi:hypothetical protein